MGYPATGDYVASALKARQAQAGSSRTVCVGIATCTRAWQVSRYYTDTWDADMGKGKPVRHVGTRKEIRVGTRTDRVYTYVPAYAHFAR